MKEKNLALMISLIFLSFLGLGLVSAENPCNLDVSLINQDPSPALPGENLELVFQVSGVSNSACEGAIFDLVQDYTFSPYENDSIRVLKGDTWVQNYKNEWMIPYTVKVDKDAFDGIHELEVRYTSGSSKGILLSKRFNISVQDSRTSFDSVIQEVSGNAVSIAIANTGKYTANSVVVRIPRQDSFTTSGTDGQMVGNLESGDYTIISFNIVSSAPMNNANASRGARPSFNATQNQNNNLKFDIYYTDELGERRVVNAELPLRMGNSTMFGFMRRTNNQSSPFYYKWWFWAIVIVLGLGFAFRKKITERYASWKKSGLKRSGHVPNWIANFKDKGK